MFNRTLEERFWGKVNKNGPVIKAELGNCWIWEGGKNNLGYGHLDREGLSTLTHRVSYELSVGPIPEGMDILHRCDNPTCVRPSHLFSGTQKQNIDDMFAKGRGNRAFGEDAGHSTLTTKQVREIRRREISGERQCTLAKEFGVKQPCVSKIARGKNRKYE